MLNFGGVFIYDELLCGQRRLIPLDERIEALAQHYKKLFVHKKIAQNSGLNDFETDFQKVDINADPFVVLGHHPARENVGSTHEIQKAVDHLPHVGAEKPVLPFETLVVHLLEGFEVVFHAKVEGRILRIAQAVDGFRHLSVALGCDGKPKATVNPMPGTYSVA